MKGSLFAAMNWGGCEYPFYIQQYNPFHAVGYGDHATIAYYMFDFSLAHSLYRDDCTTVQPPAIKIRVKTRYK